jgi:hypothetical protein
MPAGGNAEMTLEPVGRKRATVLSSTRRPQTAHLLPRRAAHVAEPRAYNAAGQLIYESGAMTTGTD